MADEAKAETHSLLGQGPGTETRICRRSRKCVVASGTAIVCAALLILGLALGLGTRKANVDSQGTHDDDSLTRGEGSPTGVYSQGAVASDSAECSTIGKRVLQEWGGSSVDAAIATLLCNGVHNSNSMGIGGGFFMVIYDVPVNGTYKTMDVIDAREVAPLAASRDMFSNGTSSSTGGKAIGVPGEIAGYYEAWKRYGRIPWKRLFEPAIMLCRNGYKISESLAEKIRDMGSGMHPSFRSIFRKPDASLYQEGDILYRPELAATLETIAREGPDVFYHGSLADDIVQEIQAFGGIHTKEDLANYQVRITRPVVGSFHGNLRMFTPRPPSSGAVMQFILNVIDALNITEDSMSSLEGRVRTYQGLAETYKYAYALRTYLGDEAFVGVAEVLHNLTSKAFAKSIAESLDFEKTHEPKYYGAKYFTPVTNGTAHLSVLGPGGSATAVTSTINGAFGSKRRGEKTGIIYNNEMDDFSVPDDTSSNIWDILPSEANFVEPGKRPLSSMCPTIVLDEADNVVLTVGTAGGSKITTTNAFVTMQHVILGKGLTESLDTPRLHHQLIPNELQYEEGMEEALVEGLHQKGHVMVSKDSIGVTQGISISHLGNPQTITAVSDRRKTSGAPDGY